MAVSTAKPPAEHSLSFRPSYIVLPMVALVVSVILAAFFYNKLPAEVAVRFNSDGSPSAWMNRSIFMLLALLPQFVLTALAGGVTWGTTRLVGAFRQSEGGVMKPETTLRLMGNMMVLLQIVLGYLALDIFSYNSYGVHLLPLWVFALIVMVVGGIILGAFFIRAMWRVWKVARQRPR